MTVDILVVVNVHVVVFWLWRNLVWRFNTNVTQNLLPPPSWYFDILALLVHCHVTLKALLLLSKHGVVMRSDQSTYVGVTDGSGEIELALVNELIVM